jgi:hypothetical protein
LTSFFWNPTRQFPEQSFSGIASLLMSLYHHPWYISKSTPRLQCGGDTLPVTTAGCVGCLQFGGCLIDGRRSRSGFFALTILNGDGGLQLWWAFPAVVSVNDGWQFGRHERKLGR